MAMTRDDKRRFLSFSLHLPPLHSAVLRSLGKRAPASFSLSLSLSPPAHNPPAPALLDAADELGFLVWDENHRNGQDAQVPLMVLRDRHHPSVIIWSICNEILCNTPDAVGDALRLRQLMHALDPRGERPVSANSRDTDPLPIGVGSPLDLQGVDYTTEQVRASCENRTHCAHTNVVAFNESPLDPPSPAHARSTTRTMRATSASR